MFIVFSFVVRRRPGSRRYLGAVGGSSTQGGGDVRHMAGMSRTAARLRGSLDDHGSPGPSPTTTTEVP
ncbi:hypothetical protein ACFQVA_22255 [Actinomadura keratinilytica]